MAKKPFPFKVCEQCCEGGGSGNGLSAYEIAVKNGFKGTESEWLESLKGKTPVKGEDYLTPDDVEQLNATPKEFVIFNDGYGAGEITLYTSSEGLHLKIEDGNGVKYNGLLLSAKNKQIQADCDTDGNPFKTHYSKVGEHATFASVTFPGAVSIIGREDGDLWIEYDNGDGYRQQKLYDHSTNQICGNSGKAEKDANGNIIHEYYATKEEVRDDYVAKSDYEYDMQSVNDSIESFARLTDEETTPFATKDEVDTKIQTYIDEAILGGAW